jgi:hypothetical protein
VARAPAEETAGRAAAQQLEEEAEAIVVVDLVTATAVQVATEAQGKAEAVSAENAGRTTVAEVEARHARAHRGRAASKGAPMEIGVKAGRAMTSVRQSPGSSTRIKIARNHESPTGIEIARSHESSW